jgi:hypothetical protein
VQLLGAAGNQRLGESHGGDGWSKVGLKLGKVRYDWKNFRTKIGEWMCADPSFFAPMQRTDQPAGARISRTLKAHWWAITP